MFIVFLPKEIKIDIPLRKPLNYKYLFCLIMLIMKKLIILSLSFLILIVITLFTIQSLKKTIDKKNTEKTQLQEVFWVNNNLNTIEKLILDLKKTKSESQKKDLIQKIKNSLINLEFQIAKDYQKYYGDSIEREITDSYISLIDYISEPKYNDFFLPPRHDVAMERETERFDNFIEELKLTYDKFLYPDKKTEIAKLRKIYNILIDYVLISLIIIFCINILLLIVDFIILKTKFKFSDFDFKNHQNQIIQTAISILSLLFIAFGGFDNDEDILILLKILVSAISFYFVWLMKDKKSFFFLLFILLGILFNPFIQFEEEATILLSFPAIVIFFIYANLNFKKQKKD